MRPTQSRRGTVLVLVSLLLVTQTPTVGAAPVTTTTPRPDRVLTKDATGGSEGVQLLQTGATITSPGPLTRVFISPDLNCAVNHRDDVDPEFYDDTACATLLVADGVLYGPADIPAGVASDVAFTPVSQTPVTATGSA